MEGNDRNRTTLPGNELHLERVRGMSMHNRTHVTFLKTVMTDPQNVEDVRAYSRSSLRVATFCAEPTSPVVQQFGMELVTPWYINAYWATEHGGIVWTHHFGNGDFPLRADAHTYPLPWIAGDVWVADGEPDGTGAVVARTVELGE